MEEYLSNQQHCYSFLCGNRNKSFYHLSNACFVPKLIYIVPQTRHIHMPTDIIVCVCIYSVFSGIKSFQVYIDFLVIYIYIYIYTHIMLYIIMFFIYNVLYIMFYIYTYLYNGKKLICYNRGGNGRVESISSFA